VILMKVRQKTEKKAAADQSPTTTLQYRGTLDAMPMFLKRGESETIRKDDPKKDEGAAASKKPEQPLGLWQGNECGSAGQGDGC